MEYGGGNPRRNNDRENWIDPGFCLVANPIFYEVYFFIDDKRGWIFNITIRRMDKVSAIE